MKETNHQNVFYLSINHQRSIYKHKNERNCNKNDKKVRIKKSNKLILNTRFNSSDCFDNVSSKKCYKLGENEIQIHRRFKVSTRTDDADDTFVDLVDFLLVVNTCRLRQCLYSSASQEKSKSTYKREGCCNLKRNTYSKNSIKPTN